MSLVSAGVSVTVTDDSFFIPASASTVPLMFIATETEKDQPNGDPALGTYEYDVIRTVTSLEQSIQLYGVPRFVEDFNGNAHHADARNEYGLFALNQFLGVGNRAFVLRSNVNLNDDRDDVLDLWTRKIAQNTTPVGAAYVLEGLISSYIVDFNIANGYTPIDINYKTTVDKTELLSLIEQALEEVLGEVTVGANTFFEESTFRTVREDFLADHSLTPLNIYPNGYDQPPAPADTFGFSTGYIGVQGMADAWEADGTLGSIAGKEDEFAPADGRDFLIAAGDDFQYTIEFLNGTTLGANDAARRVAIAQALASSINSNTEIRSDKYEYNLILCPGYPEVADEMVALSQDIGEEAFVIADTPMSMTPEEVVAWGDGSILPWPRQRSTNIGYYYPHCLASNLDGKEVLASASGTALRTFTVSDEASELWFAPAGVRRGSVTGVAATGYASGELGKPTTFTQLNLNQGQRDDLYKYFTNINPIVDFPSRGILVWGQKTSASAASALDRINVVRMLMYVRRQLRKNTLPFVFEPNDQLTRDNLKAVVDGFLGDILTRRGLTDFATVCDETNNTPTRIDRNEMYIDVALKPTKAAEFLYIPIRVVSTDAEI